MILRPLAVLLLLSAPALAAESAWSRAATPAPGPARPLGGHAAGCIGGAEALPLDGPNHAVLRPQRNRFWGHPELIAFLQDLAARSPQPLLVGDLSQPRGGPMSYGHGSHQSGLDVDIWFRPRPQPLTEAERAEPKPLSVVLPGGRAVNPETWTPAHLDLLRLAASDRRVDRLFVNPAIKLAACQQAQGDRTWLRKLRPWVGHDEHVHVRLSCPTGAEGCRDQEAVPLGEGCGPELMSWFEPPEPGPKQPPKPKPALPQACAAVLEAPR